MESAMTENDKFYSIFSSQKKWIIVHNLGFIHIENILRYSLIISRAHPDNLNSTCTPIICPRAHYISRLVPKKFLDVNYVGNWDKFFQLINQIC